MNAALPVQHAAEIKGEAARREAAHVETRRDGTQEVRALNAAIAAMSVGRRPGVGPVTMVVPRAELGFGRSTVPVESVVIHVVLTVASLNATVKCRCGFVAARQAGRCCRPQGSRPQKFER